MKLQLESVTQIQPEKKSQKRINLPIILEVQNDSIMGRGKEMEIREFPKLHTQQQMDNGNIHIEFK